MKQNTLATLLALAALGASAQFTTAWAQPAQAAAQRAFDEAVAFTRERKAFGKNVIDFQNTPACTTALRLPRVPLPSLLNIPATRATYAGVGLLVTRRMINCLAMNGPTFG